MNNLNLKFRNIKECEPLMCFVDKVITEEVSEAQIVTTTTITKPSNDDNVLVTDVLKTETSVTKSHTEQIKPKKQSLKEPHEESENLLVPLVINAPLSEGQKSNTSEPKEV